MIAGRLPAVLVRAAPARRRSTAPTRCRRTSSRSSCSRAVGFALYRRLVLHPKRLEGDKLEHTDALIILSMIAGLMVTLLLFTAFELRRSDPAAYGAEKVVSRPLAMALGAVVPPDAAHVAARVFWWAHALLILVFLNYLPYSKHLHVIVVAHQRLLLEHERAGTEGRDAADGPRGGDVEQFGATRRRAPVVEEPARRLLVHRVRPLHGGVSGEHHRQAAQPAQDRRQHAPAADGEGAARRRAIAWSSCAPRSLHGEGGDAGATTVDAGARAPPARQLHHRGGALGVHELPRVRHGVPGVDRPARRDQRAAAQPGAHRVALPGGAAAGVRVARAQRLAVGVPARPTARRGPRAWTSRRWPSSRSAASSPTSCSGSAAWARSTTARRRSPSPSRASSRRADIRFAILGQEESCHGDPARRMGNEYLYQMLAKGTIETLDRYEVTTIVTHLPALLPPDRQRVPAARRQLRGHPPLDVHRAAAAGGPRAAATAERASELTVAYHDCCYLGRYNDVYDAPRETLKRALPVVTLVEPARTQRPRPVLRRRRRPHVDGGDARASASTSSAPRSCSPPAPTRSPWRARSA